MTEHWGEWGAKACLKSQKLLHVVHLETLYWLIWHWQRKHIFSDQTEWHDRTLHLMRVTGLLRILEYFTLYSLWYYVRQYRQTRNEPFGGLISFNCKWYGHLSLFVSLPNIDQVLVGVSNKMSTVLYLICYNLNHPVAICCSGWI